MFNYYAEIFAIQIDELMHNLIACENWSHRSTLQMLSHHFQNVYIKTQWYFCGFGNKSNETYVNSSPRKVTLLMHNNYFCDNFFVRGTIFKISLIGNAWFLHNFSVLRVIYTSLLNIIIIATNKYYL